MSGRHPSELKRSKKATDDAAAAAILSTTTTRSDSESIFATPDPVERAFRAVKWDSPVSEAVLKQEQPEFMAWLEDEKAWSWHMCYSEKDGFKLMGSERDGQVFLWKYCIATGAMSMAVRRQ